jgi:probable phosphomutase (TIGR03848 family)
VTTVLLVRHGLTALTGPVLAGWTPGIHLDERGRTQAAALAERLRPVPLDAVVTSPLERCRDTADAILAGRDPAPPLHVDERVGEVRYGSWTGRPLRDLAKEPLWKVVQGRPSAAVFPDGEGLADMSARATAAVRDWNARLGEQATYVLVTHADVIKALAADALGLHLDGYQRFSVEPCSLTVIRYAGLRATLACSNDTGGDLSDLVPRAGTARRGPSTRPTRPGGGAEAPGGSAEAPGGASR